MVVELPKGAVLRSERRKDRMTYLHQHCQIDLTQVINVCLPGKRLTDGSLLRRKSRMSWKLS
jgi:mRNA capping enzyme, beta chain